MCRYVGKKSIEVLQFRTIWTNLTYLLLQIPLYMRSVFLSTVGFQMCSRPPVTAPLLGRRIPALNQTSGSSPSYSPDKLPASVPYGPATHLCVTCAPSSMPPVQLLDLLLMENPTLSVNLPTPFTVGMKLAASPPPLLHYWRRQGSLRSVSTIPFVPLRSRSLTSPLHMCPLKWKSCPIKKTSTWSRSRPHLC